MNEELKIELSKIIVQSPISNDLDHATATLKWLFIMNPEADLALQIAAFGHDIDRGISKQTERDRPADISYDDYKAAHAERSAEILANILTKNNYDKITINKVSNLVKKHEVGGEGDAEVLKDADSIAYFDLNIPIYLKRNGKEKTRAKIHLMFDRASDQAQKIIREMRFSDPIVQELVIEEIS